MNNIQLSKSEVTNIFDDFEKKNILIIGDVMVDSYWWGSVNRISPEAPVPIVLVNKREYRLGGAANVALNIKKLGANPILCSVIGDDNEGEVFLNLLEKRNIKPDCIIKSNNRPTTLKTRVISNEQQQSIRLDTETDKLINLKECIKLKEKILEKLDSIDSLIFQDYDKGVLSKKFIQDIIDEANKRNIPTIVDPKRKNFNSYKNSTLFKPNFKELKEGLGILIEKPITIEKLRKVSNSLFDKMNISITFITLSEQGVYINDGKEDFLVPTHKRSIYDVSGAGDTVASITALSIASQHPINLLAELTNIAGGLVCERVGVVPIERGWMEKECIRIFSGK